MGLQNGEKIVSMTYIRDGKTYTSRPATKEEIEQWHKEGLIENIQGTCTCGSSDFCDTINGVRVRCFEDSAGVCNWHSTNDVC